MTSATIKLFLPRGDAKSLRIAEISNWSGKAVAAPRTELEELLARDELEKAGVYILIGSDPLTNAPSAYIGEAEIIRDRLKQRKTKEVWVSAIVFVALGVQICGFRVSQSPPKIGADFGTERRLNEAAGSAEMDGAIKGVANAAAAGADEFSGELLAVRIGIELAVGATTPSPRLIS